jgi:AraC family transcriptional regulator
MSETLAKSPTNSRAGACAAASLQRAALKICNDVIATPMPQIAEVPDRDTLITTPWLHNEMHEHVPALPAHAIVSYFGKPTPRDWRVEGRTISGIGRSGTIGIVPAHWDGHWNIGGEGSVSYVFLSEARFNRFAQPYIRSQRAEVVPRVGEEDPIGAHILQALSYEAAYPDRSGRLFIEQALDLLCLHVLRRHASTNRPPAPSPRPGMAPRQVKRVTAYIKDNLERPIGLDELADVASLSRSHFCVSFRQATGCTPHGWLVSRRMERAQELLRDEMLEVTDIALSVGYQTSSAFTVAFKRHVGMTPSQYRRSL